jgi:hypothetical protein
MIRVEAFHDDDFASAVVLVDGERLDSRTEDQQRPASSSSGGARSFAPSSTMRRRRSRSRGGAESKLRASLLSAELLADRPDFGTERAELG